jgi:hypothetical protein
MKTLLLTVSLLLGALLGTLGGTETPREYNIGLCAPAEFVVVHAQIDEKHLVISAVARGPESIQVLKEPAGYDLKSTDKDGFEHFVGDKAEFLVKIVDGHVSGSFVTEGEKYAVLIGAEGKQENTGSDGNDFYSQCEGHRQGDKTDKASN